MAANLRRDGGRARQSPAGGRSEARNKGTEKAARKERRGAWAPVILPPPRRVAAATPAGVLAASIA